MADAVSIISLLEIAAPLTKTVLKYVSAVKNASKEFERLSCELTNLPDVFTEGAKLMEHQESREKFARFPPFYDALAESVIALENARAKLERRSTAKGLGKVYNRLEWPIDKPDIQKLLSSIQRHIQIFQFVMTAKDSETLSQVARKASEMLDASDRTSQTQSKIVQAVEALPTRTEIIRLHSGADEKQYASVDQDFLRQLSTLDFTAVQKESYSKRYANTGQWLLDSSKFQAWLVSEGGQHSVLWYQGDPGVGKTVITSIAVNHVTEIISGRPIAIVYIYCDYRNAATFAVENLLGSIVRQLVEQTCRAETIAELKTFLCNPAKNRKMTEEDLLLWIETISRTFKWVYTFVDALDECPEDNRDKLMRRVQRCSLGNMRIFLTSRCNVDVKVHMPRAIRAGIAAFSDDIAAFVESKIHESSSLARCMKTDTGLGEHILRTICSQSNGVFLLARLQVMSLSSQISPRGVRSALERLPTDLFTIYDQIIDRIRDQPTKHAELGLGVLSTIFGATRPLRFNELGHALAICPGNSDLDFEEVVGLEAMLSVTAGLVTTSVEEMKKSKSCSDLCITHCKSTSNSINGGFSRSRTRYGKKVPFVSILERIWKRRMR